MPGRVRALWRALEDFAIEQQEREKDFEFMKVIRESYKLCVQGSIQVELFETAGAP